MIRHKLPFLLVLFIVSCSSSRVAVTLDQTAIRFVDHATLFSEYADSGVNHASRQVLQLNISSETDLLKFFIEQGKQLQVRCSVTGNANGEAYNGFAIGPLPDVSNAPSTIRHRYTIYAFIDLDADSVEYEGGKPASTLNLKSDAFESLSCHLLGVEKAPVPFLRSNDLSVSASTFKALLRQVSKQ